MNEALIPASAFVVTAIIGWGFYVRGSHWAGNTFMGMSLAGLWALSVIGLHPVAARVAPSIVRRSPSTVHAAEFTVNRPASTVWVSTLDRAKKVYHRATCQYVGLMDKNAEGESHKKPIESPAAAEALGYEPCSKCFSTARLATRQEPP